MEPLLIILIPGIFGGLVLSLLIARNRRGTPPTFVSRPLDAPSPALINMAHIKVEGLGGLGLVAAVTVSSDRKYAEQLLQSVEREASSVLGGVLVDATVEWLS